MSEKDYIDNAAAALRAKAAFLEKILDNWEDRKLQAALANDGLFDIDHYSSPDEIVKMFYIGSSKTRSYLDTLNR